MVYYFAYGSNMSRRRLRKRIHSTEFVGAGSISGYYMSFSKKGADGSAKCGLYLSDNPNIYTHGVIFSFQRSELERLDEIEGNGYGYQRRIVPVTGEAGDSFEAITYIALNRQADLLPFTWYKYHVCVGAREAALPGEYQHELTLEPATEDQRCDREAAELNIYSDSEIAELRLLTA